MGGKVEGEILSETIIARGVRDSGKEGKGCGLIGKTRQKANMSKGGIGSDEARNADGIIFSNTAMRI